MHFYLNLLLAFYSETWNETGSNGIRRDAENCFTTVSELIVKARIKAIVAVVLILAT